MPPASRPHRLALYQAAVQHPQAEVALLGRMARHHTRQPPLLFREDFAGTAALSAAWIEQGPDHQALAIDHHGPTLAWAQRYTLPTLGERAADLHLIKADVRQVRGPKVDLACALNFSIGEYHTEADLRAYLRTLRQGLRPGGVFACDLFGGPGALRPSQQDRTIPANPLLGTPRFRYTWEQVDFDPTRGTVHCQIHFALPGQPPQRKAFAYHWRLWSMPELRHHLEAVGFEEVTFWCDRFDPSQGQADGHFRPVRRIDTREDWIAYVTARRPEST